MYCVATIQEIQRIACVAPTSIFHVTLKDVQIEGYKIDKGQYFLANLTKFMNDPEFFPEPNQFNPNRFLQDNDDGHRKLKVIYFNVK